MRAEKNSVVLFQFDGQIVAQARFIEQIDKPLEPGFRGRLLFEPTSIFVFKPPLTSVTIKEIWPDFERFSQVRHFLKPQRYPLFRKLFVDLQVPISTEIEPPRPGREVTSRIIRDSAISQRVKELNGWKCQLCGKSIELLNGEPYAEGHHIRPLGSPHDGDNIEDNLLCVCPNCHVLCDFGVISLSLDTIAPGHKIAQKYIAYHNQEIYQKLRH